MDARSRGSINPAASEHERPITASQLRFPQRIVIWAGDFNQSLSGPNLTGSTLGRRQLRAGLARLNLTAWNGGAPHAKAGMSAIDLICGPELSRAPRMELIPTHDEGRRLSDHVGYVVEL